jgi:beta-glucosidase
VTALAVLGLVALAAGVVVATRVIPSLPKRKPFGFDDDDGDGPFAFPAGFLWGASTSDQQIEHQQPSDWTDFENRAHAQKLAAQAPGNIHGIDKVPLEVLRKKADFDRLYPDDLKRASSMGHNAHRFSLSWARLFPNEDEPSLQGLEFYGRILDECARNSLVPFVTLHHFAIPSWLARESGGKRGLERSDAAAHFEKFTKLVVAAFGDRVRFWCTLNEPMVVAQQGYLEGTFPPNEKRKGVRDVEPVVRNLRAMHAAAYVAIHEDARRRGHDAMVGIAQHVRAFMPLREHNPLDRLTAQIVDKLFVLDFLDHLAAMDAMDYVGVNFYGRTYLKLKPGGFDVRHKDEADYGEDVSDLGWTADEASLTSTLTRFHERYALPLFVLENGTADDREDDDRRQRGIVRHAHAMWRAIEAGVGVRGYFHWSLLDNFEWAEGFGPRFGLYNVEYERDFARTPRKSVDVYKAITSSNSVPVDVWRKYRR